MRGEDVSTMGMGRNAKGQFVKGHKTNEGNKRNIESIKKMVNSRMLNGSYKENGQRVIRNSKGKTYEEIYGSKKAQEIKDKIGSKSIGRIPKNKGISYEDFFGIEEANRLKEIIKNERHKQIFPMNDTTIEKKIQLFLDYFHIEYYAHKYISEITHSYQCDIFIPVQEKIIQKTIIECDGDYWHGNPKICKKVNTWQQEQIEEDKIRTKELIEKGFRVIRLWENDIKKMNIKTFEEIFYGISLM